MSYSSLAAALCAKNLGRFGLGCELATAYWLDSVWHLQKSEGDDATPSLFDLIELESA